METTPPTEDPSPNGTQPSAPAPKIKVNWWTRIFHHPNFGAITGIVGILGFIFGFYFYYASKREPDLTYYVSPTRTEIVQTETLQDFSVNFHGITVTNNISAVHIQVWNKGKEPIRHQDILKKLTVGTLSNASIYQVIIKPKRQISDFTFSSFPIGKTNSVEFDWMILEKGDGADIQIIYGGDTGMPFNVDGIMVGQDHVSPYRYKSRQTTISTIAVYVVAFGAGNSFGIMFQEYITKGRKRSTWMDSLIMIVLVMILAALAFLMLSLSSELLASKLPFGF